MIKVGSLIGNSDSVLLCLAMSVRTGGDTSDSAARQRLMWWI